MWQTENLRGVMCKIFYVAINFQVALKTLT